MIKEIKKLKKVFKKYPQIKLVYLFGSRAKREEGPISDYDFAIWVESKSKRKIFEIQSKIFVELSKILKTDKIDIIFLNLEESPELKFNVLKEGILIYEKDLFRVLVEPRILNEYFDFRLQLEKFDLAKK